MTGTQPLPGDVVVDDLDQPFWDGCREGKLLLHECSICSRRYWPASCCILHGSEPMRWVESSGRGVVHTFTIFHQVYGLTFLEAPYNVTVVKLDEGPLFHTRIIDCDDLQVGLQVEVAFENFPGGVSLPLFRRVPG
jgi:uncharacterized protein